jgi:hypothetical protein
MEKESENLSNLLSTYEEANRNLNNHAELLTGKFRNKGKNVCMLASAIIWSLSSSVMDKTRKFETREILEPSAPSFILTKGLLILPFSD